MRLGGGLVLEPSRGEPKTTYVSASDPPHPPSLHQEKWEPGNPNEAEYYLRILDKHQENRETAFSCSAPQEVFSGLVGAQAEKQGKRTAVGLSTNRKKFGKKSTEAKLVLQTWEGCLLNYRRTGTERRGF